MAKPARISSAQVLRWSARSILALCALCWLVFGVLDGASDAARQGPGALLAMLIPGLILLTALLLAWKSEILGGVLLAAAALFFFIQYFANAGMLAVILIIPALLSGILFVLAWYLARGLAARTAKG